MSEYTYQCEKCGCKFFFDLLPSINKFHIDENRNPKAMIMYDHEELPKIKRHKDWGYRCAGCGEKLPQKIIKMMKER